MKNGKKIHNIVASIVFAPALRELAGEFMVGIRGFLRRGPAEEDLFRRLDHDIRQAAEFTLSERAGNHAGITRPACPECGPGGSLVPDGHAPETFYDADGNAYLERKSTCAVCGREYHTVYRLMGVLSPDELESLKSSPLISPFQDTKG